MVSHEEAGKRPQHREVEKKSPDIKVELTNVPEEQHVTKVHTALAGQPPDLRFVYERRWLAPVRSSRATTW